MQEKFGEGTFTVQTFILVSICVLVLIGIFGTVVLGLMCYPWPGV